MTWDEIVRDSLESVLRAGHEPPVAAYAARGSELVVVHLDDLPSELWPDAIHVVAHGADAVGFAGCAWRSTVALEDGKPPPTYIDPSRDPKRESVLIFAMKERGDGQAKYWDAPYDRVGRRVTWTSGFRESDRTPIFDRILDGVI